jgi:hypothetical protein
MIPCIVPRSCANPQRFLIGFLRSQRAVYGSTDDALSTTSSTGSSRHSGGSPLPSSSRGPQSVSMRSASAIGETDLQQLSDESGASASAVVSARKIQEKSVRLK